MNSEQTTRTQRILVVDDEEYIRDLVGSALRLSDFEVVVADDGATALRAVPEFLPNLIILDVNMPGLDGFEVCRRLRRDGDQTPVVFLTARGNVEDRLSGLTKGGDDYLTKPFSLEELLARIRAVLRRTAALPDDNAAHLLSYADLHIDESAHRITRAGQPIDLSPTEFKLLRYLLLNSETVLSKSQIMDHVWEYDFDGDTSVVEKNISHLRKKIDSGDAKLIHTVRGFGYVLRSEP